MNKVIGKLPTESTRAGSADKVYEDLRLAIIRTDIPPGTDLDEKSLVEKFGVSRTPVREALIRLAADGLVEMKRNRGASVTWLDLQTLQSIFEAGDLIEQAIMRLACLRRTQKDLDELTDIAETFEADMARADIGGMVISNSRFHQRIAEAAKNKYFVDCYRRILADHERVAQMWYSHNQELEPSASSNDIILVHHRQIIEALDKRDPEWGEKLSKEHADLCKDGVRALLASGEKVLSGLTITPGNIVTAEAAE